MAVHDLKCWPPYFAAVLDGSKTFEVRRNDRGFAVGDTLLLQEWEPRDPEMLPGNRSPSTPLGYYTGREVRAEVRYVLDDSDMGLAPGFVALGISLNRATAPVAGVDEYAPSSRHAPPLRWAGTARLAPLVGVDAAALVTAYDRVRAAYEAGDGLDAPDERTRRRGGVEAGLRAVLAALGIEVRDDG